MATGLSLDQLANLAAGASGLPLAFCKALIAEEGTYADGHNNPFDVTDGWANQAGYGHHVIGVFGSQGNIAVFDDENAAIQAWAAGVATFSNYAQFRTDQAAGASAYQLALDLQSAGYAGSDGGYAQKIANLVAQYGGRRGTVNGPMLPPNVGPTKSPSAAPLLVAGLLLYALWEAL